MAHENIDARRAEVSVILETITREDMHRIALKYGCSYSTVSADITFLRVGGSHTIYVSKKMKSHIIERDESICQYCFSRTTRPIVDHVIPSAMGGPGLEFNLVVACDSCNQKKKNAAWVPNNIAELRELNFQWAAKIEEYAGKPIIKGKLL